MSPSQLEMIFFEPNLDETVNYKRKMNDMNTNTTPDTRLNRFSNACVGTCRKLINAVKASLLREFSNQVETHNRLLRLALNEAEALADQTAFPGLFFPVLAEEKVRA